MDFNINNETFANAYKCLKDANMLLESGLGNFDELDKSALILIEKNGVNNNDRLNVIVNDCQTLSDKMYRTIECLAKIDYENALYFEDILKYGFDDLGLGNEDIEVTSYDAVSADGIKYSVDIIGEVDENTTIILLNHGAGGSYKALDSFLENGDIAKGNAIIIRYPLDGKSENAYKLMEEVSDKYNVPIQNCTTAGFSAGGKQAIKQMADLVAAHPEIEQPVVMLIDAYEASKKVTDEELKALGDSGAIIFSVQRDGVDEEYINHEQWANEYGINFVKVDDNQCKTVGGDDLSVHSAVFSGYFASGLFNYQVGEGNIQVKEITTNNGTTVNNYDNFRVYNAETGEWDSVELNNKSLNETYKTLGYDYSEDEYPTISLSEDPVLNDEDVTLVDTSATDGVYNPNDPNVQPKNNTLIAHRGYAPGGIYENSKDAFIAAGESGFWGAEADVRFDSEGNLVVSHNSVKAGEEPISVEEYLDICAEYGMTAIIDLKYPNGTEVLDTELSTAVLKVLEDKGMTDMSVLQTNNAKDVAYIRENSDDARIWYLKDVISDSDMELIQNNDVECVNIKSSEDKNMYRIKELSENGVDVCVWNVQNETYKNALINNGATYVMTDYAFDVSPYQEGDVDYNSVPTGQNSKPVVSLSTDSTVTFSETTKVVEESVNAVNSPKSNVDVTPVVSASKDTSAYYDRSVKVVTNFTNAVNSTDTQVRNSNVNPNNSDVPLIYQSDYSNVNYGTGTVASHGCGIAALSMVASYYNDADIMPDELASKYRVYGSKSGTDHGIFEKTAEELNLPFQEQVHYCNTDDLDTVVNALSEGCVVVAKAKQNSVFTDGGHYIVLTGVSDDGKIYVNDPNKYNYNNSMLIDGYENGFDQEKFMYGKIEDFFIYSPKS